MITPRFRKTLSFNIDLTFIYKNGPDGTDTALLSKKDTP
jgi:hypothetical protein